MLHFHRKFSSGVTAHPQRGKAQQEKKRQCGPERQRRSKAAHSQENWKAQQEKRRTACPHRGKAQQERGVVKRRSEEPSKC